MLLANARNPEALETALSFSATSFDSLSSGVGADDIDPSFEAVSKAKQSELSEKS
jgi:hypothetical protein